MTTIQKFFHKLNEIFNTVTDWLLIVIGVLLVIKSAMAIDVPIARYTVMGAGALLIVLGFWYRHRRKRRHR